MTFTLVDVVKHGSLEVANNDTTSRSFNYIPDSDYIGKDSFTFKVNNGIKDSKLATVSLNVYNPVPKVLVSDDIIEYGLNSTFHVEQVTEDGTIVKYVWSEGNTTLSEEQFFDWIKPSVGVHYLTLSVTDNLGAVGKDDFIVTVQPYKNKIPYSVTSQDETNETIFDYQDANISLEATDQDDTNLTFIIVTQPSKGTLTSTYKVDYNISRNGYVDTRTREDFKYTPNVNASGDDSFTYKINDGEIDSAIYKIDIHITPTLKFKSLNYAEVTSARTNRVWLDRNLGATDRGNNGDLYQWGRKADGHQLRDSTYSNTDILSTLDENSSLFISNYANGHSDWTSDDKNGSKRVEFWSKTDGSSICPAGYRVPTRDELLAEFTISGNQNQSTANLHLNDLGSSRKLDGKFNGGFSLWTTTLSDRGYAYHILSSERIVYTEDYTQYTFGDGVRCIKAQ